MSRVGNQPIKLAKNMQIDVEEDFLTIKLADNTKKIQIPRDIKVSHIDNILRVDFVKGKRIDTAEWGSFRQNVNNIIIGMTDGFSRKIILTGTGYKADVQNDIIKIYLGYSHPIYFKLPKSIKAEYDKSANFILLKSDDKKILGDISSLIKSLRPTEPYKGKGVRFEGEYILRKEIKNKK